MKTKTIKQSITFKTSPHEVYEALMDEKKHSKFTGSKAKVSGRVSGSFSIFDGGLVGTNVELVQDKRIVQAWKCVMDGWPEKHFSKAVFSLKPVKGGTKLDFTQTGVPEECFEDISKGWKEYYWSKMKKLLEKQ